MFLRPVLLILSALVMPIGAHAADGVN